MYDNYFSLRGVAEDDNFLPFYLHEVLPINLSAKILDIGCGLGGTLQELKERGYSHLRGVEISDEAVEECLRKGLDVEKIVSLSDYCCAAEEKYDFIIICHVLEHLSKDSVIKVLTQIREHLLAEGGEVIVTVPNAQSNTGCYWAYEDFTHETLYTAGSLQFVLRSSGFTSVHFVDPDGLAVTPVGLRWLKRFLLKIYKSQIWFWNRVTGSSFHVSSPQIFNYELKALAKINSDS